MRLMIPSVRIVSVDDVADSANRFGIVDTVRIFDSYQNVVLPFEKLFAGAACAIIHRTNSIVLCEFLLGKHAISSAILVTQPANRSLRRQTAEIGSSKSQEHASSSTSLGRKLGSRFVNNF